MRKRRPVLPPPPLPFPSVSTTQRRRRPPPKSQGTLPRPVVGPASADTFPAPRWSLRPAPRFPAWLPRRRGKEGRHAQSGIRDEGGLGGCRSGVLDAAISIAVLHHLSTPARRRQALASTRTHTLARARALTHTYIHTHTALAHTHTRNCAVREVGRERSLPRGREEPPRGREGGKGAYPR